MPTRPRDALERQCAISIIIHGFLLGRVRERLPPRFCPALPGPKKLIGPLTFIRVSGCSRRMRQGRRMEFELAQLLESAGWPQGGTGKWVVDPAGIVGRRRVYQPTLEELIEGCGRHLIALQRGAGGWTANALNAVAKGRTPAEAVAHLWLQLEEEGAAKSASSPCHALERLLRRSLLLRGTCRTPWSVWSSYRRPLLWS